MAATSCVPQHLFPVASRPALITFSQMCELPAAFRAFAWLGWISSFLLISLVVVAALMEKRPEIWREQFAVGRMQEAVKNKEEAEAEHIRMIEARGVTV